MSKLTREEKIKKYKEKLEMQEELNNKRIEYKIKKLNNLKEEYKEKNKEKLKNYIEKLDKEEELNKKTEELKEFIKGYRKYKFRIKNLEIDKEMNALNNIDNSAIDQLIKLDQNRVNKIDEMMEHLKNNNIKQYRAIDIILINKNTVAEGSRIENISKDTMKFRLNTGLKNIINNFDI